MIFYKTFLFGLAALLFSWTAPFMVPFALFCTKRESTTLAWPWYDTPDEPDLYDLQEPGVKRVHDLFGHWLTAYYWFGIRNRGHGFDALFARPWPRDHLGGGGVGTWHEGGLFAVRKQWGFVQFFYGWQAYRSKRFETGFEVRPKVTAKFRKNESA
ncbi:MAG: hypothetical protein K2X51_12500 [Burkholderiales bacterium]|nr:hypothetical protein [Burkholderiales bacterium]